MLTSWWIRTSLKPVCSIFWELVSHFHSIAVNCLWTNTVIDFWIMLIKRAVFSDGLDSCTKTKLHMCSIFYQLQSHIADSPFADYYFKSLFEHYFQTDDCLNLTFFNPQRLKTAMTPTIDLDVMAHLPEKQNLVNLMSEKLLSSVPPVTQWPHTRPGVSRLWAISIIIPVTSKELLLSQTLRLYFNN